MSFRFSNAMVWLRRNSIEGTGKAGRERGNLSLRDLSLRQRRLGKRINQFTESICSIHVGTSPRVLRQSDRADSGCCRWGNLTTHTLITHTTIRGVICVPIVRVLSKTVSRQKKLDVSTKKCRSDKTVALHRQKQLIDKKWNSVEVHTTTWFSSALVSFFDFWTHTKTSISAWIKNQMSRKNET